MARAHLPVDVELAAAFLQAQAVESKVSWIACTIKGEAICLVKLSRWSRCASVRRGKVVDLKGFTDKLVAAGIPPPAAAEGGESR